MQRSKLMQLSRDQHVAQLQRIISPDQRAAYYKAFIDPTSVDLATAENLLLVPFLQENAFVSLGPVGLSTIEYPMMFPYNGGSEILESVATFLTSQWNVPVSSDNMYGSSGVIAALEVIALALFNPGDEVLVPAPTKSMPVRRLEAAMCL